MINEIECDIMKKLARDFTNTLVVRETTKATKNIHKTRRVIYCDAGYGFPSQARPRRERVLAVAKQMVNFLIWQKGECSSVLDNDNANDDDDDGNTNDFKGAADIILCNFADEHSRMAVEERMKQLLNGNVPAHVTFSTATSSELDLSSSSQEKIVYLSPDADDVLDPNCEPPDRVVVGLLIDRRIQPNRSKKRAATLGLPSARLALDTFTNIDSCEPLNVDTVLVGMQQWWWNCDKGENPLRECFIKAVETTMEQHVARHPNRPLHKPKPNEEA